MRTGHFEVGPVLLAILLIISMLLLSSASLASTSSRALILHASTHALGVGDPAGLGGEVEKIYPVADIYAFGKYSRSQLKFDISTIPHGAEIISAELWLYRLVEESWDGNITVYRVDNQIWDETISAKEFNAQTLTDGENLENKFMSHGWDNIDVFDQMKVDYEAKHVYTSFRLRWAGDNGSEPSGAIDDGLFLVIQSEIDNLGVFFWSSEYVGYHPYLKVVYLQPHAVSVSISPIYQSGKPGETLEYTVTVTNTGSLDDNYILTVGDNAGWGPALSDNLLEVPAGENTQTTLSVTVPANALGCSNDNLIITATSRTDNTVSDSDSCIAHTEIVQGVQVSISPSYREGLPGDTLIYQITVKNAGNINDTYTLENIDNLGWSLILGNTSLTVPPFGDRTTDLTVAIPEDASPCTSDNIRIIVTSQENENVVAENSCIVHVIAAPPRLPTQPQLFSPGNGSEVSTRTPTLRWENAMYAENHRVLLDDDSDPDVDPLYDHTVVGDNKWMTPDLAEDETYYWKVIAQNENGENHSVIWRFTVNAEGPPPPTNDPPTADAGGPYLVKENGTIELDGTGSTDPDGDPLTYSWAIVDDPTGEAVLTGKDTATPIFHAPEHVDDAVDVTVKLSVNDGHGHTDSDNTTVTVQPTAAVNLPPIAEAGGPYWVQENEVVKLDGTGSSDPDGTIVTYSWKIVSDPTGEAFLTDSDTVTPVFHAPSVDSDTDVIVELTVEDDDGATGVDNTVVRVRVAGVGPPLYGLHVSVVPSGGGTVILDPPGGIYEEGTEVTVTAEPADNYEFDYWSGDASGTSTSITVIMDSDKSITANFRARRGRGLLLIQLGIGMILILIIVVAVIIASRRRISSRRR